MTVNTYAISIEFIGTRYRGWQRQQEVDSIQQHVEAALSKIANEPIEVIAAEYYQLIVVVASRDSEYQ